MSEKLSDVVEKAIRPALAALPARMRSREAVVMLLAIGLQESLFRYRRQMANGPARGFWQFEKMGGVAGVLQHRTTTALAAVSLPLLAMCMRRLSMTMCWALHSHVCFCGLIQKHCQV